MINYLKQDIFLADVEAIAHQANCFHTMGSGIAKHIRERFPEAYEADLLTKKGDPEKMGRVSIGWLKDFSRHSKLQCIFNLYSQFNFGLDTRHTRYDAMHDGLVRIRDYIHKHNSSEKNPINKIAVPFRMGCDRGGGDWRIADAILNSVFKDDNKITLIVCDNTGLSAIPANINSR